MTQKIVKKIPILFLVLYGITSCAGQRKSSDEIVPKKNELGVQVDQLGKRLWYVFQDSQQNYWFGSDGEGVFRYDGKTIRNYTTKDGLSHDQIRQIQEDKEGNLYFSTLDGINKFDGNKITKLEAVKSTEWKLDPNDMWFFMLGKKDERGPYRYDGEKLYRLEFPKHYLHDEFMEQGINPFFSPYEVYTIYKDRSGDMWFGTSVFGACRFDGKSVKWMYEKDLTIVPAGGSFGIRSIFEDKEGRFWICNTAQRFIFDDDKTNESDRLVYQKSEGIGNAEIFLGAEKIYYSHIVENNDGAIWLITWDQGVFKYDGTNITHFPIDGDQSTINLVSMHKDKHGTLWLGTNESGVFKFNGQKFERFEI